MVLLGSITKLETDPVKDTTFPLQVHFREKSKKNGSPSPWVLDFMTSVSRGMNNLEILINDSKLSLQ